MFLTHSSCHLHVPLGHGNRFGVPSLFIWILQGPLVTSRTHHTPLSVWCHSSPCPLLGKQSVLGKLARAGGQGPFPPTQGTAHSLHCSCSLSCLHWEYFSTLQLPYCFYSPVFLDKLCLQTSTEVLMMQGYALGTAPHSAVAQHAACLTISHLVKCLHDSCC